MNGYGHNILKQWMGIKHGLWNVERHEFSHMNMSSFKGTINGYGWYYLVYDDRIVVDRIGDPICHPPIYLADPQFFDKLSSEFALTEGYREYRRRQGYALH
jgi:hypothetical protein